ncbi:sn1-specific diacylglycerol lipase alpha-like [Hordeum vulgare]|uniref:Fungal lipase-type domain-containing protein n=1 Tax=Hordeum vulgare subsp. vulgare TaxID=112509 RepID=A0A8I6Y6D6_HORVV|nr:uncharacterized protein LOC123398008 [Hordeum vulgare subsp. vulgare]KAE8787253.1 sn1-specific diacylglycerol lipase alpha-like [Hordeum vulgare]KAI4987538.1 hypothetical protein ZWY2020_020338 [Hordeum vulgare]
MGSPGMATAAGTAVLVYLVLSGRLCGDADGAAGGRGAMEDEMISSAVSDAAEARERRQEEARGRRRAQRARRGRRWPERAPDGWGEAVAGAARTVRFAYGQTLGKWSLGELAFGINYYMRQQGNLQHEYAGSDSVRLGGPGAREELISLLGYMKLCMYFSKKPYKVFLEFGGFDQSDVLIKKSKARFLKPAFTVVRDRSSKCFLLFIRGAISIKERLTAATGADIPFHHVVAKDGCVSNLVLGYAHCGMATAARWIANQAIPCLSKAVEKFPDHRITIIGHSMGASIAALLTYILRENDRLLSSTCIAFGPAACMTWDLAESGKDFITTIVNRNDVVPSLGRVSTAKLHTEVMASSWVHELREQIQQTRFLGFVNRSVSFVRSHVPFISDPKSKVVDVDMLQSPASEAEATSSEDAHCGVKKRSSLVCWSCSSAQKQSIDPAKRTRDMTNQTDIDVKTEKNDTEAADAGLVSIYFGELNLHTSDNEDTDKEDIKSPLKSPLKGSSEGLVKQMELSPSSPSEDSLQLYPPGRILHMVALPAGEEPNTSEQGRREEVVTLYETPRHLYSKIRLGRSMVGEHYMPKYIRTMELLIEKLAKEDMDSDQLDLL